MQQTSFYLYILLLKFVLYAIGTEYFILFKKIVLKNTIADVSDFCKLGSYIPEFYINHFYLLSACAKLSLNSWQYVDRCYSIVTYCDTWASEFSQFLMKHIGHNYILENCFQM